MPNKKENYCLDCNKLIYNNSIRCMSCSAIENHRKNPTKISGKNNPMYGTHRSGKLNPNWQGGKYIHGRGYMAVYCPSHPNANKSLCVPEHRLVMEKKLGRYLKKEERVHHKNNNKTDNRIGNLKLFKNDSEHKKYHRKRDLKYLGILKARIVRLSKIINSLS